MRVMRCRIRSLCVALFCCGYTFVAAEAFLRLLAPVPIVPRHVTAASYGIRVNEPNQVYWHTSADFKIQIRTNSRGVRSDREILYEKPPGVRRIVVLGDSFGMGYEVNLEDSFLHVMEQTLREAGANVEVVNLSVSGHGNAEELIMLREEGLKYDPDLVLLCWHATDYEDNVRSGLFGLENGSLVRKNAAYLPGVATRERLSQYAVYRWAEAHSQVYAWTRECVAVQIKRALAFIRGGEEPDQGENRLPSSSGAQPGTPLTVALLREIQRESQEHGARFLILDIPVWAARTEFFSVFPHDASGNTFDLPVVNPTSAFLQEKGALLYWERSQGHFTPLGCRQVGQVLATAIREQNLLHGSGRAVITPSREEAGRAGTK